MWPELRKQIALEIAQLQELLGPQLRWKKMAHLVFDSTGLVDTLERELTTFVTRMEEM